MSPLAEGARVAVLAAMQPELQPIVSRFALRALDTGGERVWLGRVGARELVAAVTSMGPRAAAHCTTRLLDAHPVDHVVVVGIAGAVAPALRIGDLLNPALVVDEASGAALRPTPLGDASPYGRLLTTEALHRSSESLARLQQRDGDRREEA
jgi:nucleoside phosphorylase